MSQASLVAQIVKNPPAKAGDLGSIPGSGRSPWRREWLPTPVFLPGESHGQRSLEGCSPCGQKAVDMTKRLTCTIMSLSSLLSSLSDSLLRAPDILNYWQFSEHVTLSPKSVPHGPSFFLEFSPSIHNFNFSFNRAIIFFLLITIAHFHVNFLTYVSLYQQNYLVSASHSQYVAECLNKNRYLVRFVT